MSNNKSKLSLLIAALLTMGHSASQAKPSKEEFNNDFAPIESLAPEERANLHPQIEMLRRTVEIDWNSVAIGINSNGKLILKGKGAGNTVLMANPTCWAE